MADSCGPGPAEGIIKWGGGGGGADFCTQLSCNIIFLRTSVHVEVIHTCRNARANTSLMHNKIDLTHLCTKMSLSIIISRGELRGNFVQVNISCSVAMNHESS